MEKPLPSPETQPTPEPESTPESAPRAERAPAPSQSPPPATPAPSGAQGPRQPTPRPPADPVLGAIERILSEDLYDLYRGLPQDSQATFLKKGEETAGRLRAMVGKAHLKAKDVLTLIVNWLKLIPGVNRFFLEQESKIKTDKIVELHRRRHGG